MQLKSSRLTLKESLRHRNVTRAGPVLSCGTGRFRRELPAASGPLGPSFGDRENELSSPKDKEDVAPPDPSIKCRAWWVSAVCRDRRLAAAVLGLLCGGFECSSLADRAGLLLQLPTSEMLKFELFELLELLELDCKLSLSVSSAKESAASELRSDPQHKSSSSSSSNSPCRSSGILESECDDACGSEDLDLCGARTALRTLRLGRRCDLRSPDLRRAKSSSVSTEFDLATSHSLSCSSVDPETCIRIPIMHSLGFS